MFFVWNKDSREYSWSIRGGLLRQQAGHNFIRGAKDSWLLQAESLVAANSRIRGVASGDIKRANLQTSTGATSSLPLLRACLLESIAERCAVEPLRQTLRTLPDHCDARCGARRSDQNRSHRGGVHDSEIPVADVEDQNVSLLKTPKPSKSLVIYFSRPLSLLKTWSGPIFFANLDGLA